MFYTEEAKKRLKLLKGIEKSKTHKALSTQPHQTQGKGRQVSIYSISAYCNMTKYRSAACKMEPRQIAQQMVQPISEETSQRMISYCRKFRPSHIASKVVCREVGLPEI